MKVFSAKVVNGRLDVGDAELPDGTTVTVIAEDDAVVEMTDEQRALLRTSITQADRGETIEAAEVLKPLRS